jgi:hypothetical protein
VNLIHRPEQITVDYPWMVREFLSDEGLASNGVGLSRIFAPLGFFQELLVYGVSSLGAHDHGDHDHEEEPDEELIIEAENDFANQAALVAQLRNYWDLSSSTNLELGGSFATGKIRELEALGNGEFLEVFESQKYYGGHVTVRWRPLQQGLYRCSSGTTRCWSATATRAAGSEPSRRRSTS